MLTIARQRRTYFSWRIPAMLLGVIVLLSGLYVLALVLAPQFSLLTMTPLTPAKVAAINVSDNRIIIPKIGVNIHYGTDGTASLNEGALWRYPDRGNPVKGGNFIIAAHRFSIEPTPGGTIVHSPFYHIDALQKGDQILVDYDGQRYGYEVEQKESVSPNAVQIEAPSDTPKLTLYSCDLAGSAAGRYVIIAKPLGEVTVK